MRRRLHQGERLGVDQVGGLGRQRAGERDDVGGGQQLGQPSSPYTASAPSAPRLASRRVPPPSCRTPWRAWPAARRCGPGPTISSVLPPSSSSRAAMSEIMPRQILGGLVVAPGVQWRFRASISAMACSATACALTPAALARRMPCARSSSRSYWSMPALIDWMNLSRLAAGDQLVPPHHRHDHDVGLRQPRRHSSGFETWKWAMPVPRAAKRAAIW